MENQQNPFCLAQYIVTNPETKSEYDFLDVDPMLKKLTAKLFIYMVELITDKDALLKMIDEEHPNMLYQRLAEKADEFCPGRSYSDLLFKQIIVYRFFTTTINSLLSAALKSRSSHKVTVSFHQMSDLAKEMEELRKSFTL